MSTPDPDALLKLTAELRETQAKRLELKVRVRKGTAIPITGLEKATIDRAHLVRNRVADAPSRYVPMLAAKYALERASLGAALVAFGRAVLTDVSRGATRQRLEAAIARDVPPPS